MSGFFNLNEFFEDAFFPPLCSACGRISTGFLCEGCAEDIRFLGLNVCVRCGAPLVFDDGKGRFDNLISGSRICSLCKKESYNFYKSRSFAEYGSTVSKIISKYKYRKYYYLADLLAGFLKKAFDYYYCGVKIDFLDTVPDYNKGNTGYAETGKNHMHVIAGRLSELTGIPFADNMMKTRDTYKQQVLDRSQRVTNLREAFKTVDCLKACGMDFLLIDDVWTTGSTLNELSLALKRSGADKIYLLTIARKL